MVFCRYNIAYCFAPLRWTLLDIKVTFAVHVFCSVGAISTYTNKRLLRVSHVSKIYRVIYILRVKSGQVYSFTANLHHKTYLSFRPKGCRNTV